MSTPDKITIYRAFIREIEAIGVEMLENGHDCGDPLEQVRQACAFLEDAFNSAQN